MTQSKTAPVFNYASLESPVVYHQGKTISLGQLLQTVDYLAERIPEHQHVLNLCEQRYYFLLGFLLALKQQSISLFPTTLTTHVFRQLKDNYDDILVLSDNDKIKPELCYENLSHYGLSEGSVSEPVSEHVTEHSEQKRAAVLLSELDWQKPVAIIFTSGSTGQPKPFKKQWGDLVAASRYLGETFLSGYTGTRALDKEKIFALVATVPAQHMYGLEASIIMALQNGLLIHSDKPFFPQDITHCLEDLQKCGHQNGQQTMAAVVITTPLHLKACIKTEVALPGVGLIISATAPLENELAQLCENQYSTQVMEIFGCTEIGSMAWRRTIDSEPWTVLNDISLEQKSQQAEVQINTTRSIKHFLFNDIVDLLDKRHFLLRGRKEDLINQAGKRTSLSYLNHHLQSYEKLMDACYYQDDSTEENRLLAFVVLKSHSVSKQEKLQQTQLIRQYLNHRIEAVFLPKKIYFVTRLPRNATGKLPLSQLKDLLLEQELLLKQESK